MPSKKSPHVSEPPEQPPFTGRPCYDFNPRLKSQLDDTSCYHCRHYLTTRCPHLDEFLERIDEMDGDFDAGPAQQMS